MHYLLISLMSGFLALTISSFSFASANGLHKIEFHPPHDMPWKTANIKQDRQGYTKLYIPKKAQNDKVQSITINYGRGIKTSLKASMQDVLAVVAQSDCQHKETKIIKQQRNMLIFWVEMDHCLNGKSLLQLFKVFNTEEGQYSIFYTADQNLVQPKVIRKIKPVIEKAQLVPK